MTAWEWTDLWPDGAGSDEWAHSGIEVLADGRAVFCAPEGGRLIVADAEAGTAQSVAVALPEVHGISLRPGSGTMLWLADPGAKARPGLGYDESIHPGRAVLIDLGSRDHDAASIVAELSQPELPDYEDARWRPTSVVEDDSGAVWVADGYGESLVHRFDADGTLTLTLRGAEGVPLDCPHGLVVDRRRESPEILVADRGNRRIVAFGIDGSVSRVIASDLLTSPSCLAQRGTTVVVTDLHGGLLEVGPDDEVARLTDPPAPTTRSAPWPNVLVDGALVRPTLTPGVLNSPHGVAVDATGDIFLTEWLIGGAQWRLRERP
ncbi:hypothetical protein [Demequina aurantiaca]|uniref:hypothetical protein n=1 Tax=Demequina aurantiaca TaxID=676200 RepID=UPI0007854185|nr:hypothetical protein [Demequina aurantiaca]